MLLRSVLCEWRDRRSQRFRPEVLRESEAMANHEHEESQEATATSRATLQAAPELSIVMPCLNEAETIGTCIQKAQAFLHQHQVVGEIVVADNGSTDGSQEIASLMGARVVSVETKGYGSALMGGISAARGKPSVQFLNLNPRRGGRLSSESIHTPGTRRRHVRGPPGIGSCNRFACWPLL